jgi:hypothetical protein
MDDQRIAMMIKQCWLESGTLYGYRKVTSNLRYLDETCGKLYRTLCRGNIYHAWNERKLDCCEPNPLVFERSRAALGEALLRPHGS